LTARTLSLRGQAYPLVLPNVRDPRLHVAAVIITIHVLGQVALAFRVSVPQILAAILASAVLEIVITFRQARAFVWPASAMLTGSGVALILRVVGTPVGDHWTTYSWELYAIVGGLSLLSKYLIRYRGTHVFNPSNVGLVVTFLVLGSTRVEPLDFWWAPLGPAMLLAYLVIAGGGLLITRRLSLLGMAASFWLVLAGGVGILAASGHCMTANWAFAPVCGGQYWTTIVTSPEVLIFLFFMITDPKTTPTGRVGRVVFGALVGIVSTLLMAPQADEFGTKVGLLTGLVLVCAARPIVDRLVPEPRSEGDDLRRFATGLLTGAAPAASGSGRPARAFGRAAVAVVGAVALGAGIVLAGAPARGVTSVSAELLTRDPGTVDPATLPTIRVGEDVTSFDERLAGSGINVVVVSLAQNLQVENQAILRRDESLLPSVDHGDRLAEMQARVRDAASSGTALVEHYRFDSIDVALLVPFGQQTGLSLGLTGRGTVTRERYDASGALIDRTTEPFERTFALRQATGARWLNVAVLPR
jgi:Na+-translocating ferredoxin:NAD+ oxidoreductase RnfD subunit